MFHFEQAVDRQSAVCMQTAGARAVWKFTVQVVVPSIF